MKKRVLLRAPVLSQSGYGVHARQVGRWLLNRKDVELTIQPVQWGMTPWKIDYTDTLINELMQHSVAATGTYDVSFQLQLPNEWTTNLAKFNVGMTAGVETNVCNPDWVKCINDIDSVIVPSTFTKNVFEKSGTLNKQLSVIPEAYIDSINDENVKNDYELSTSFNFLLIGQLTAATADTDRKNIFNTIKWFCEVFKDDENVGLIIKTNHGRESKIDRKLTAATVSRILSEVRKGPYPRIHLVHGMLNDSDIAGLYKHKTVKCVLSLTRGEGFGLPLLEAAASGVPIIATNWSGHLDFLRHGKFIKVDFELKQIPDKRVDEKIFMKGTKWADPIEIDAKKKLEKFKNKPEIPTEWASELAPIIKKNYSFSRISSLYDEFWEKNVR